jgi:pimeloyl-ACP methyl ester carboxylesterase
MRHVRNTIALAALVLFAAQGAAVAAPADSVYATPGRIVTADDGARLNLYCLGEGSPTVVFDAGHQGWAPAWAIVQPKVAQWTRACAYDRSGFGFSDAGPRPRTSARIAEELHSALRNAGVNGPYILVGHRLGGFNMRAFAYDFMPDVAGLVLLDTDVGDTAPADLLEGEPRVFSQQAVELRVCRDAVAKIDPAAEDPAPPGPPGLACDQRFFRGFPEAAWSADLNAALLRAVRTRVALYDEDIDELLEIPGDEGYLREHRRSMGSRPLRILTLHPHYSDDASTPSALHFDHLRREEEYAAAQAQLLALSSNAKQIFVYKTKKAYIQFDEPEVVVDAIREAYDQSR